ncbi:MAG: hypothetical protein GY795_02150 [Desulfobacterales bacterium]|nr:hypothetical protein [Desulfobacterales bacterium]
MKTISVILITITGFMVNIPITAMENQLSGDWEMKAFTMQTFTGQDQKKDMNINQTESTASLAHTCIINEKLRFVNKFELSAVWGRQGKPFRIRRNTGL